LRELTTEEQRERFYLARKQGGQCVACGRTLGVAETVYTERFEIGPAAGYGNIARAAVGVECASLGYVDEMEGHEPERCAGCGRGVYYQVASTRRQQALCSRACGARAQAAKRSKAEG
jgi:hypothetical protein